MPRTPKKYHYIYKTTNTITGRWYIGMHSTNHLENKYLGSGKQLRYAIKKYGITNFKTEILEFCDDRKSLAIRESEIITETVILDPMCMNLKPGGSGGLCNDEHRRKFLLASCVFTEVRRLNQSKITKDLWKNETFRKKVQNSLKGKTSFIGKKHSTETKNKISDTMSTKQNGSLNSQFGTRWISDGVSSIKIKKTDEIPNGWFLGRRIK